MAGEGRQSTASSSMSRSVVIAFALILPLAAPAAAQDCACAAGGFLYDGGPLFDSIDPPETVDPTIESADPHVGPIAEAPAPRAQVLWCSSPNDPRCSPLTPNDLPTPRSLAGGPSGAVTDALRLADRRAVTETSMTPRVGLVPAPGVTSTIDRPPRG